MDKINSSNLDLNFSFNHTNNNNITQVAIDPLGLNPITNLNFNIETETINLDNERKELSVSELENPSIKSFDDIKNYTEQYENYIQEQTELINNIKDENNKEINRIKEEMSKQDPNNISLQKMKELRNTYAQYTNQYDNYAKSLNIEGVNDFDSLLDYIDKLENQNSQLDLAINQLNKTIVTYKYNLYTQLEDYQNFGAEHANRGDFSTELNNTTGLAASTAGAHWVYNGTADPLEVAKSIEENNIIGINSTIDSKIHDLAKASKENPELGKIYSYIYKNEGVEAANKYLEDIEDEVNKINGKIKADEFLKSLSDKENAWETIKNEVKVSGKGLGDGVDSFVAGFENWITSSNVYSADEYESMYILQALQSEEYSGMFLDNNYELSQSIGNMIPSMAIGIVLTPGIGATTMGISAGGNSYHSALVEGYSTVQAILYGCVSGVSETLLERYLGSIPGLSKLDAKELKGFKNFLKKAASEGIEEGTQEFVDALSRAEIFGEDIDIEQLLKDAGKSALYGAIIGSIMNTGPFAINSLNDSGVEFIMKGFNDINSKEELQKRIDEEGNIYELSSLDEAQRQLIYDKINELNLSAYEVADLSKKGIISIQQTLDYIESGKTFEEIWTMFENQVGKNIASWVPNKDSASQLYIKILKSCNNANIEINELNKSLQVMEAMEDYYLEAANLNLESGANTFETYRTHGVVHILDVLTESINAYQVMNEIGVEGLDYNAVMIAAAMHDTGMAGGQQLILSLNENGELQINTQTAQKDGITYRESHSFNSGINVIENFETLRKLGYSDIQIAEAALLAFSHSKSNSGLNPLSENPAGWSFAIQALDAATKGTDFNFIETLVNAGILKSSDTTLSEDVIQVKSPKTYQTNEDGTIKLDEKGKPIKDGNGGKITGKVQQYEFVDGAIEKLSYESLTVRIGDALTNNDHANANQYLGEITFDKTDYSKQYSLENVLKKMNLNFEELLATDDGLLKAAFTETKHNNNEDSVTFEVNGKVTNDSQPFVLGENNQIYSIKKAGKNEVEVVVTLKNSENVPFCTLFAIEERVGELVSKGDGILTPLSDEKELSMAIEIDSDASPQIKSLYEQYVNYLNNEHGNNIVVKLRNKN